MIEVSTDIDFKKELINISNASLNECMQCGTCSAVCSLSVEDRPFPRKEMIWAGWGMKDKLMGNPNLWLCHQCGDCSTFCPRNVKPSDVLASLRQMTYQKYAKPQFLSALLNRPSLLPIAILIPVSIILIILKLAGTLKIPEGDISYAAFFPHGWLNASFTLITFFFYGLFFIGLRKFRIDMKKHHVLQNRKVSLIKYMSKLNKSVLSHSNFSDCEEGSIKKTAHILIFYGFILLIIVTLYAIVAALTNNYPLGLHNPFKITGNVAGLMVLTGTILMIFNRLVNKKVYGNSNYADWLFLISILLLTISGGIVEMARFQNWSSAYHLYFFHLVCVWFVIIYLPYTKFGHFVYRMLALSYIEAIKAENKDQ